MNGSFADRTPAGTAPSGDRDVDRAVGRQVRLRRILVGLSQSDLARSLGVTKQQMALFETGQSRLYASHLYLLARALDVPPAFFFEPLGVLDIQPAASRASGSAPAPDANDVLALDRDGRSRSEHELKELAAALRRIRSPGDRRMLLQVMQKLSE